MTYDQIVTLDAIVRHGSFKAAAEFLHKSQPSLSMAIKKLEEEFGIKIFNREEYRPTLTDDGKAFYSKSLIALDKFHELSTLGKELAMGLEAEISIAIDAICPLNKISSIFESFLEPHITTSLNLSVDILEELERKVLAGEVNLAIGHYTGNHHEIESYPILKTQMVPVVASTFYDTTDGSLDSLFNLPQIIVKSSAKASTQKILGSIKGMRRWFTSDMSMKEQLIVNKLGWGRLPLHQVQYLIDTNKLTIITNIPEINAMDITISVMRNINLQMGPNTRKIWNYLLSLK
jgi:DNA-binding transcriptional LysR family regulator